MRPPLVLTRRGLTRLLAGLAATLGSPAAAGSLDPPEPDGGEPPIPASGNKPSRDKGIGGTGVTGTIRRFGSIIVNDLRITYPETVGVTIDGHPATAAALRIGHVVQVVARRQGERLATGHITVTSEVVGPVEVLAPGRLTVLGQAVETDAAPAGLHPGELVAVSGLRRLDGTIIASLIERRAGASLQVAGPVTAGLDGVPRIGSLAVAGLDAAPTGRVVLTGRLAGGVFRADTSRGDTALLDDPATVRASVEAYVAPVAGGLRFGSGLSIAGSWAASALTGPDEGHVVAEIEKSPGGSFHVVRMHHRDRGPPGSRPGPGPGPGPGHGPGHGPGGPGGGKGPGGSPPGPGGPHGPGGRQGGRPGPSQSGPRSH